MVAATFRLRMETQAEACGYLFSRAGEAVSQCHSEARGRRISKNVSSVNEILRFAQNDKKGVMTQPLALCHYNT